MHYLGNFNNLFLDFTLAICVRMLNSMAFNFIHCVNPKGFVHRRLGRIVILKNYIRYLYVELKNVEFAA